MNQNDLKWSKMIQNDLKWSMKWSKMTMFILLKVKFEKKAKKETDEHAYVLRSEIDW